jgi:hypothetical protein
MSKHFPIGAEENHDKPSHDSWDQDFPAPPSFLPNVFLDVAFLYAYTTGAASLCIPYVIKAMLVYV